MAISNIVCRGFGTFGGGVHKVPTRGYAIATVAVQITSGPFYIPGTTQTPDQFRSSTQTPDSFPGRNNEQVQ